jgi:hypothetical protein
VTQRALRRDDVAAGRDEAGRVEVAQVVEPYCGQAGVLLGEAPSVADGVLVRRATALPAVTGRQGCMRRVIVPD